MIIDNFIQTGSDLVSHAMYNPFIITICVIVFAFFYYLVVSAFLEDVVLQRLTKASFEQSIGDFSALFFSYLFGMFFYMYVIYFTNEYINPFLLPKGNSIQNIAYIIPFGLSLLYTGRIITRKVGVFYGKLHFASIFLAAAFALGIDVTYLLSEGPLFSIKLVNSVINYLLEFFIFLLNNSFQLVIWIFIGGFALSTIGEYILARQEPREKSLLAVAHKFPSDLKVTTGSYNNDANGEIRLNSGATDIELRIMLNEDLVGIKCVTKTLNLIEYLEKSDINFKNTQCKILRSPLSDVIKDRLELKDYNKYSLKQFIKYLSQIVVATSDLMQGNFFDINIYADNEKIENWIKKSYFSNVKRFWIPLISKGVLGRTYYFGEIRFILTENRSGHKKILFLVRDMSPTKKRIGLYSTEPYITDHFEALFDRAWASSELGR